jgi:cell division topological specificity factor
MNLFNLFRSRATAPVARDRLQILLAHERTISGGSDLVAILREEILAVIKKHISVDAEKVMVKMDRGDAVSTLEVDIEIPTQIVLAKKDRKRRKNRKRPSEGVKAA